MCELLRRASVAKRRKSKPGSEYSALSADARCLLSSCSLSLCSSLSFFQSFFLSILYLSFFLSFCFLSFLSFFVGAVPAARVVESRRGVLMESNQINNARRLRRFVSSVVCGVAAARVVESQRGVINAQRRKFVLSAEARRLLRR